MTAPYQAYDEVHAATIQSALRCLQTVVKRAQDDGLNVELETVKQDNDRFSPFPYLTRLPVSDWTMKATHTYE